MEHGNKVWLHYVKNIIAADIPSAVFLASYLRYLGMSNDFSAHLEIIDLQKYKIIKKNDRVRSALREKVDVPFIFVIGKN